MVEGDESEAVGIAFHRSSGSTELKRIARTKNMLEQQVVGLLKDFKRWLHDGSTIPDLFYFDP